MRQALTFYKFTLVDDVVSTQTDLQAAGAAAEVRGTILVAEEGVNGTLIGSPEGLETMRQALSDRF